MANSFWLYFQDLIQHGYIRSETANAIIAAENNQDGGGSSNFVFNIADLIRTTNTSFTQDDIFRTSNVFMLPLLLIKALLPILPVDETYNPNGIELKTFGAFSSAAYRISKVATDFMNPPITTVLFTSPDIPGTEPSFSPAVQILPVPGKKTFAFFEVKSVSGNITLTSITNFVAICKSL